MDTNTTRTNKSFDRHKKPPRQNFFFLPFIWLYCFIITKQHKFKLNKINMEGLKPPYLVYSTHHSFMDFYVAPIALFPHRANFISELEGFIGMEWFYRQVGCLCKRKFTTDLSLIHNINHVVSHNKDIMVIYPEARYCNVGTNSLLPDSIGKLAKSLHVPVVILHMKGNYLQSPIWNLIKRKVRLEADLIQVITKEELKTLSHKEISQIIRQQFVYDDYKWQKENKIEIDFPKRAEGLHHPLYWCPHCGTEFQMGSKNEFLICNHCKKQWEMTLLGELKAVDGITEFTHIPDWYEKQRSLVWEEIANDSYRSESPVQIDDLPNAKGFIDRGIGNVIHDQNGYHFSYDLDGIPQHMDFEPASMVSVHNEYNYKGKGPCITLSTLDNTFFLFPLHPEFDVTKVQFATEELYRIAKEKANKKNGRK